MEEPKRNEFETPPQPIPTTSEISNAQDGTPPLTSYVQPLFESSTSLANISLYCRTLYEDPGTVRTKYEESFALACEYACQALASVSYQIHAGMTAIETSLDSQMTETEKQGRDLAGVVERLAFAHEKEGRKALQETVHKVREKRKLKVKLGDTQAFKLESTVSPRLNLTALDSIGIPLGGSGAYGELETGRRRSWSQTSFASTMSSMAAPLAGGPGGSGTIRQPRNVSAPQRPMSTFLLERAPSEKGLYMGGLGRLPSRSFLNQEEPRKRSTGGEGMSESLSRLAFSTESLNLGGASVSEEDDFGPSADVTSPPPPPPADAGPALPPAVTESAVIVLPSMPAAPPPMPMLPAAPLLSRTLSKKEGGHSRSGTEASQTDSFRTASSQLQPPPAPTVMSSMNTHSSFSEAGISGGLLKRSLTRSNTGMSPDDGQSRGTPPPFAPAPISPTMDDFTQSGMSRPFSNVVPPPPPLPGPAVTHLSMHDSHSTEPPPLSAILPPPPPIGFIPPPPPIGFSSSASASPGPPPPPTMPIDDDEAESPAPMSGLAAALAAKKNKLKSKITEAGSEGISTPQSVVSTPTSTTPTPGNDFHNALAAKLAARKAREESTQSLPLPPPTTPTTLTPPPPSMIGGPPPPPGPPPAPTSTGVPPPPPGPPPTSIGGPPPPPGPLPPPSPGGAPSFSSTPPPPRPSNGSTPKPAASDSSDLQNALAARLLLMKSKTVLTESASAATLPHIRHLPDEKSRSGTVGKAFGKQTAQDGVSFQDQLAARLAKRKGEVASPTIEAPAPKSPTPPPPVVTNPSSNGGGGGDPARALYPYVAVSEGDLEFNAGDTIRVLQWDCGDGWAEGVTATGVVGMFPASYVEKI